MLSNLTQVHAGHLKTLTEMYEFVNRSKVYPTLSTMISFEKI